MKLKSFDEYIGEGYSGDQITLFDLDDTLVVTSAKIKVHDPKTGENYELTPQEFNTYKSKPRHELDMSDFRDLKILKAGQIVEWVLNILKATMKKEKAVGIITAREDKPLVLDFLRHHKLKINPDFVFAIHDKHSGLTGTIPERKQQAFQKLVDMGFKKFSFYDDSEHNLKAAKDLEKKIKGISIKTKLIQQKWLPPVLESSAEIRYWALFAHISDFFSKANNPKDLDKKYKEAIKLTRSNKKNWPVDAVKFFFNWFDDKFVNPVEDLNRLVESHKAVALEKLNENKK